jgi:hypothetical protein
VVSERFPDVPWQIGHRLDRETSGALAMANGREAAAAVKGAFASKRAAKTYLAICHGRPPWPDAGAGDAILDAPLALSGPHDPTRLPGVRMIVRPDGLPAITRVSVVDRAGAYALVRCDLVTGRQHQIRAHLADAGFPIVGDKLYAHGDDAFIAFCDRGMTRELAHRFELPRHALHAASCSRTRRATSRSASTRRSPPTSPGSSPNACARARVRRGQGSRPSVLEEASALLAADPRPHDRDRRDQPRARVLLVARGRQGLPDPRADHPGVPKLHLTPRARLRSSTQHPASTRAGDVASRAHRLRQTASNRADSKKPHTLQRNVPTGKESSGETRGGPGGRAPRSPIHTRRLC